MENQLVFDGNRGTSTSAGDIINIIGDGINIQTICRANTILITAGDNPVVNGITSKKISLPRTNTGGSEGAVYVEDKIFIHSFSVGSPSVYIGIESGNSSFASESNIGIGYQSLSQASGANFNIAIGSLPSLVSGNLNSGIGYQSLYKLKNGSGNTSLGALSSYNSNGAFFNTTLGANAGINYSADESYNIIVGCNAGVSGESQVVRVGNDGSVKGCPASKKSFIYGIANNVIDYAVPVYLNPQTGQLGTQGSSKEIKTNIKDISSGSELLYKLSPVSFNFKDIIDDVVHYGFLAEEVVKVMPELVNIDNENKPTGVKYMEIISLLVNEVQKLKNMVTDLQPLSSKVLALENKIK